MEARTVSVSTAAKLLGVAANSYRAAARRGEVPAICIGRRQVVPVSALEKLLGERLGGAANADKEAADAARQGD